MYFFNAKKLRAIYFLALFIIVFLGTINPSFADIGYLGSSLTPYDTPARIGTIIDVSVIFTSNQANPDIQAVITASGITNPVSTQLTVSNIGGTTYLATGQITVAQGNINNSTVTPRVIITETVGTSISTFGYSLQTITIDNKAPRRNGALRCTVDGIVNNGLQIKSGQTVVLTQNVADTDIDNAVVIINGLGLSLPMTPNANKTAFAASFVVPSDRESQVTCDVTLTDGAGNQTTYDGDNALTLNIDSKPPQINVSVTNSIGNEVATAGSVLIFTANLANYDGDSVTVYCTELQTNHAAAFSSKFPVYLRAIENPPTTGEPTTFQGSMTLPSDQSCYYDNNLSFQFKARDDAGNETTQEAIFDNIIDLGRFTHSLSKVDIYSAQNTKENVATATSKLYFYSKVTTSDTDNTSVIVDLTPIGGSTLELDFDPLVNMYIATYTGGFTAKQMDDVYVRFDVTATNQYGQVITKTTTPPILVDNVGPKIYSFSITGATGKDGSIINKDKILFTTNITGANANENPVTVDLTTLDDTGIHNFSSISPDNWQYRHTVASGSVDDYYTFVLLAMDNHGNISQREQILKVDNQPPVWVSQESILGQKNPPYIIIEDNVSLKVTLEDGNDDISVIIDLTKLGNLGQEAMTGVGNEFTYSFNIATGPINNGAIFPLIITDNAGNKAIDQATGEIFNASFTFQYLDQNPPDPLQPIITLTNHTDTYDVYPDSLNTKKTVTFTLPFTKESTNDDHATATLDVTYICKLKDGSMEYLDNSLNILSLPTTSNIVKLNDATSLYNLTIVATDSIGLTEQNNYQFKFSMYDKSGNKVDVESTAINRIDLNPPKINSITVGTNGNSPLVIGDTITFKAYVADNDGQRPTIDLTSLNPDIGIAMMNYDSIGVYSYNITIATGTIDDLTASWPITLFDGCDNSITTYTREISIDNKPPELISYIVSADSITNNQRINFSENSQVAASVTFKLTSTEQLTVTFDLSAIGGSSAQDPVETISGGNYIYTYTTVTSQTSEEYENYQFPAIIKDANGNKREVFTQEVKTVDCLVPIINSYLCGVEITGRSDSLPAPKNQNIVRIGDTVTFYASMTVGLDAIASVSMCINPGVATLSSEMTYNSTKNRHEVSFTIKNPNVVENGATWGELNSDSLAYIITAADDAANVAVPVTGNTTFTVKNIYPTIASYSLKISPDFDVEGILNIGSGTDRTTRDLLVASATLDNNAIIATASLDLTNVGGSNNYYIASITNSIVNNNGNGIDISALTQTDYINVPIPITIYDEAGYSCGSSHELQLDTKIPEITQIKFDGSKIIISFSEEIKNIDPSQWALIGSTTMGATAKLDLSDASLITMPWNELFYDVEINLSLLGQKTVTNWASSSLYLEVKRNTTTAAATDFYGNWIASYAAFPINITDFTWREDPSITTFVMTQNWPDEIVFDVEFSHQMDPSTFVASDAVLFVTAPNGLTEFADVSYDSWYTIQKEDTCQWIDNKTLKITLNDNGRDWIASNLTYNTSKTLKFAQKSSSNRMVSGIFDKQLKIYTIRDPYIITDNRSSNPLPKLNILSDPQPVINFASATITLSFNDRALLFKDSFETINETDPLMGIKTPTNNRGSNLHLNKIYLFNLEDDRSIQLSCASITSKVNDYASTSVTIDLTQSDIDKILNFYNVSGPINWGIQINADSFINMWGIGNTKYKPTSPGTVNVVEITPTEYSSIIAVSVSDMPPTKDDVGNFSFDFEITKIKAGDIEIPFSTNNSPTAAIFESSTGDRIASATFMGWSTRTVRNVERTIATFKTSEEFLKDVDGVEAELRLYGLKDIFGNEVPVLTTNYVYDRSQKSSTTTTGFNSASESFIIDNVAPTANITPLLLGLTVAGKDKFYVDYSETMDNTSIPSLTLATGTTVIGFTFVRWENSDQRAVFSNNQPITTQTLNGKWIYKLSGGKDLAGNNFENSETEIIVKSEVPKVVANSMKLHSIRKNIDNNNIVVNKPLNFNASPDYTEISIEYVNASTENLPHAICFYNAADEQIGSATLIQNNTTATAAFSISDFISIPTSNTTIYVKVADSASNITNVIGTIDYYAIAPNVSTMSLTGVATISNGIYYYKSSMPDMSFNGTLSGTFNNPLNLLIVPYSIPLSPVATMTQSTNNATGNTYATSFGQSLDENLYQIYIADEAGNLNTNATPLWLNVDNTAPEIDSIIPGPTDIIANTKVGMATFTVKFKELMDISVIPSLTLATSTMNTTISMKFVGWGNDHMTASFTNLINITSSFPAGTYNYQVSNAKDLAGNFISTIPNTFTTEVQPKGPGIASLTVLTLQPDISDSVFENRFFNPVKYNSGVEGSATFRINYINDPILTPHKLLIYNESNNNIATLTISVENPGYATWQAINMPTNNATYSFKVIDSLNNVTPETGYLDQKFRIDTSVPSITSIKFDDSNIGQIRDGIRYYSPSVPATFSVTTSEKDDLVLIASSTATTTYIITASTSHKIDFGSDLPDGDYKLTVSDLAGNINTTASITLRVDSIPPQVNTANAIDELNNPLTIVGKEAKVLVVFDKIMNRNITPKVQLATDTNAGVSEVASLTFVSWSDDYSCTFITNGVFNTINFPVGTASIMVSDARDLAGNTVSTGKYGEVQVISRDPSFFISLESQQNIISETILNDVPFSFKVEPKIATISITYNPVTKDPHGLDHTLLLFDGTGKQIATHTLTGGATTIPVNEAFFGDMSAAIAPPTELSASFTIKIKDCVGNISSSQNTFELKYDSISPKVNNFSITGVSTASTLITNYYNPDILGSMTSTIKLNASDAIKLIAFGVSSSPYEIIATRTYDTQLTNALTYSYNGKLTYLNNNLPEGTYQLAAVDMAGNLAVLTTAPNVIASTTILIDKTAPTVIIATMTNQTYISSGEAGMATFSVQFDESLFDTAYQYLEIATTSYKIPCRLVRVETTAIASDTAIFETNIAIPSQIPQGQYTYHIIGTDLTGNRVDTESGEIFVKSTGPAVRTIQTFSYQQTTASDTLISGNEYHYDDPFSFNVEPKAATMTIYLSEEPDGDSSTVYVTFLKKVTLNQQVKEVVSASYPVTLDSNLMATFTWDAVTGPTVDTTDTYIIRIADINGDLSYYSYNWTVDNVVPTYSSISFNSGVDFPSSGTVYLNPYRHTNFEVTFKDLIDMSPSLRITSKVSTDTYPLTAQSNNSWKTIFRGKYSRNTGNPNDLMPDGIYNIGLVDKAGNPAASGTENLYELIIDTKAPVISTFTLKVNGYPISNYCSPSETKPLIIAVETDEPLIATGAYYIDIYNAGNVLVNRLEIKDNGGSKEVAWDGKNTSGTIIPDGTYTFKVSDICGNASTEFITTTAVTAPFKVMSPAVQIGSNTVKIWFNHGIDPNSIGFAPIVSNPALTISNIQVVDERALTFTANGMSHGVSYVLSVMDTLNNIYGGSLSPLATSATFIADVKGPAIVGTSFDIANTQSEVMVIFDQPLDRTSAEATASYRIYDSAGRSIPISYVIVQSDNTTVTICASEPFIENSNYTIKAPGVKDEFGNDACETSISGFGFKGRDVTPPSFVISAFSNAANENDIIVIAVSSEELIRIPTLTVFHGSAKPVTLTMQKNETNKLMFMSAVSLRSSSGQSGTLEVSGEDLNGNPGSSTGSFTIASVKPNTSMRLSSNDNQFSLTFDETSLKTDATVKILQRAIEKDENATGTIRTSLQNEFSKIKGLRASVTKDEEATNSELTPLTDAYEASVLANKVNQGIIASLKIPESASQTTGLGLFYQRNGSWKFISSNISPDKEIKARISSSQVFAIMQDTVAPSIKLDDSMDLSKNFETARPEFIGNVKDFGSGIDTNSIEAKIDSNVQNINVDNNGNFKFKSLSELINGKHELTISAKDRTGNTATTGSMRFALVLPFEFKQIIQYPNPARNNVTIRIRTNSNGINCHMKIKIYDVAGHKVADFDEADVADKGDGNYEVRWDLRNQKGKKVANGVYIAKLEAINPETGKKVKATLKVAVLK